jgi:hypothetical protein
LPTLFPELAPKLNMDVGSALKTPNTSLNSFSKPSLDQLLEVITQLFITQERVHISLPPFNCIVRVTACGIKSPVFKTNMKSRQLYGKIQKVVKD